MRPYYVTLVSLLLLACASEPDSGPAGASSAAPAPTAAPAAEPVRVPKPKLVDACQLRSCVCVEEGVPFFMTPDVKDAVWSKDGSDISCPEGFELRREDQL